MKIKTKEEYIAKKNLLEEKYLNKINNEKYKKRKAKHVKAICKRAIRVLTRRINRVDNFNEPREIAAFSFDVFTLKCYEYNASEFAEVYKVLTKRFDYLNIKLELVGECSYWIKATVSLKQDE